MNIVTGEIYNIYHSTDETVIQLFNGCLYRCHTDLIRYFYRNMQKLE